MLSTRRYWKKLGILQAHKTAPDFAAPPAEFFEWDEPGDPNDPIVGSLANATIHARHERGNEAISVETRDGEAATFAVVGADGHVIESGSDVAWAAWLVCTRGWSRRFFSAPIRPVFATPWGCFEEWFMFHTVYGRGEPVTEEIASILDLTEQLDTQAHRERVEARKAEAREQRKLAKRNSALVPQPHYLPHGESAGLISMDRVDLLDLERLRSEAPSSST